MQLAQAAFEGCELVRACLEPEQRFGSGFDLDINRSGSLGANSPDVRFQTGCGPALPVPVVWSAIRK